MTPTPYEAILTNTFLRTFRKLPEDSKERIRKAIDELLVDPHRGTRLMGELEGEYRWRVGDNRIDDEKKAVNLLDVGPRRSIYN